jgi:hypothetical protein
MKYIKILCTQKFSGLNVSHIVGFRIINTLLERVELAVYNTSMTHIKRNFWFIKNEINRPNFP